MLSKKTVSLVVASLLVMIVGCSNNDTKKSDGVKVANGEEITGPGVEGYVKNQTSDRRPLLEVTKDHQVFNTGSLVSVGVDDETLLNKLEEGQNVTVWYGGPILESNPPKIKGLKIEIKESKN
ncbi:DUF3221 domain-containing protein [Neobacillus notoginsengisoli]|uniref:DUF3221 domain-containing protein n=1 Tax=Neobacillus notoginsengisoli TaxID=1578198 RepID=A0A417YZP1_9BACI|nr:DUF3221 domain-containing protein [Neobacillus notoginsengisoli]RHW43363.1 DUF3221 domain-containing protein [Neobacillus notoginsengisoli]